MFYAPQLLGKKGPLGKIWLAAHWEDKVTKAQIFETNISQSVDRIMEPHVRLALRTISHLLLGVVRIYARKTSYLLTDCNEIFIKLKMAFRPDLVDLPEENIEATIKSITYQPEFHDFDVVIPELSEMDIMQQFQINQARAEAITLKEVFPISSVTDDTADAENTFGDDEDIPDFMKEFIATIGQRNDDSAIGSSSSGHNFAGNDSVTASVAGLDGAESSLANKNEIKLFEEVTHGGESALHDSVGVGLMKNDAVLSNDNSGGRMYDDEDDDDDRDMDFGGPPSIPSSSNSPSMSPLHEHMNTTGNDSLQQQQQQQQSHAVFSDDSAFNSLTAITTTSSTSSSGLIKLDLSQQQQQQPQTQIVSQPLTIPSPHLQQRSATPTASAHLLNSSSSSSAVTPPQLSPSLSSPSPSPLPSALSSPHTTNSSSFNSINASAAFNNISKPKRRRKLLIDQVRNISGEEMRNQLSDTSDILMVLDMAPPSKRMMHWRATGVLEKMFSLPTTEIRSQNFLDKYQRNLITKPILEVDDIFPSLQQSSPHQMHDGSNSGGVGGGMYDTLTANNISRAQTPVNLMLRPSTPQIQSPPQQPQTPHQLLQSQPQSPNHHLQHQQQQQTSVIVSAMSSSSPSSTSSQNLSPPISAVNGFGPNHLANNLQNDPFMNVGNGTRKRKLSCDDDSAISSPSSVAPPSSLSRFDDLLNSPTGHKLSRTDHYQSPFEMTAAAAANTQQPDTLSSPVQSPHHQKNGNDLSALIANSNSNGGSGSGSVTPSGANSLLVNHHNDDKKPLTASQESHQMENLGYSHTDMHNFNFDQQTMAATATSASAAPTTYNQPMSQSTCYDGGNMYEYEEEEDDDDDVDDHDDEMFDGETELQYMERVENVRALKLFKNIKQKLNTSSAANSASSCFPTPSNDPSSILSSSSSSSSLRFSDLCRGLKRKQTIQNFYSLLVLKKFRNVELHQNRSYDEVYISRGSKFDDPTSAL